MWGFSQAALRRVATPYSSAHDLFENCTYQSSVNVSVEGQKVSGRGAQSPSEGLGI